MADSTDDSAKIRRVLDHVGHDLDPSILIGGWATHLRVGGEISHDIDLIVTASSRYLLDAVVDNLTDNSVHQARKFRGEVEGVHLDIYVPHESQLGSRLRLKVEALARYVDAVIAPPWLLLTVEAHFITKLAALLDRFRSEKGTKDAREILALLKEGVDPALALRILAEATAGPTTDIPGYVDEMFRLIPQLAKLSKIDQKAMVQWRREWTQAALTYTPPQTLAPRTL
ncbi:hypothetical protein AAIB33_07745 [Microbacterium sp. AZCO]|uniref:hypothetical protein n=1 Tax=Microbacterium sp. AZCO TaxID=3142976 RepID=UPI0031F40D82